MGVVVVQALLSRQASYPCSLKLEVRGPRPTRQARRTHTTGLRPTLVLLVFALLSVLGACTKHEPWKEFRSTEFGFRVDLPGTPVAGVVRPALVPMRPSHTFLLERGANGSLQVSTYELLKAAVPLGAQALKIDCEYPFSGSKFRITASREVALGSVKGLAVTGEAPVSETLPEGGWEEDRCFIVGRRMYHLIAVGPNTESARRDGLRFLDSFALLGPAGR